MSRYVNKIGWHQLVQGFLFSLQADGRALRTCEYYARPLRHLLEYAEEQGWDEDVSHVDTQHLREFLSWIATRVYEHKAGNAARLTRRGTPTTPWSYFRALRRLFNWAVEEGLLETSPVARIRFKAPKSPPVDPYSQEELKKLLAVCELDSRSGARFIGLRNRAMLLVFLDSGLRRGEMTNLKLRSLNLETRRISVLGKGNKAGIAPLCPRTAKAIWLYLIEREKRAKCDSLWVTEEGRAFSVDGMDSWFNRLKQRAGVTSTGCIHKLRHTAALYYLRGAKDSFLLQLFLRHESLEMSRRYTQGLKQEEAIQAHRNGASPVEGLGLG